MNARLGMRIGVALVLGSAILWTASRHRHGLRLGDDIAAVRAERAALERKQSETEELRQAMASALDAELREFRAVSARMAAIPAVADHRSPEERADPWAAPPERLPHWDEASPFVWVAKSMLEGISFPVFLEGGALRPDVASVLTVDPATLRAVNADLEAVVSEHRTRLAARAKVIDRHAPEIAGKAGDKLTLEIESSAEGNEESREAFQRVLARHLGEQRAGLLMSVASDWVWRELGADRSGTWTLSVLRADDGRYTLVTRHGSSGSSVIGTTVIEDYIPPYLRSKFAPIFGNDETVASGASGVEGGRR